MTIGLASDHRGYKAKKFLKDSLFTPFENPVTGYTLLQIRLDDCPEKEQYIEVQLGE